MEAIIIQSSEFWFKVKRRHHKKRKIRRKLWGYKFRVEAELEDVAYSDFYQDLHRSTFWLASKCAA